MQPNLSKSIERIIRKQLPGQAHVGTRKLFREMATNEDGIKLLRCYIGDYADGRQGQGTLSQAAQAVITELERIAKDKARTLATNAEIAKAINDGCPTCGRKIKRNLSLTGWWQCSQFGAVGFRAEADKPACNWQAFYVEGVS